MICVPGGTRVLFGDSRQRPALGLVLGGVGWCSQGVGLGAVPDVVKLHVGPFALMFAIVLPTMRQK